MNKRIIHGVIVATVAASTIGFSTPENAQAAQPNLLASGHNFSFFQDNNGGVWAWGIGNNFNLGDGTNTTRTSPIKLSAVSNLKDIDAGAGWTVALKSDGTVWSWGVNAMGSTGQGMANNTTTRPTQINGFTNVKDVDAFGYNGLAIKEDGTVWGWGSNYYGQVGNGNTTDVLSPAQVSGLSNVVSVASGYSHSLAVKSDGTVWAWGSNGSGQLGDGTTVQRTAPIQVRGLTNVVAIDAGQSHSLALKSDGTVWAWGQNYDGQLGNGTTTYQSTPVQVSGLSSVVAVKSGSSHSLALKSDGTVWTWGDNSSGQIGDGTTADRTTPFKVPTLTNVAMINSGNFFVSALKTDGTIWSWGGNSFGELGDGTTIGKTTPIQTVIDMIPPTPATFSPSTTSPTNLNVTVTINYPADATVKQYKIGESGTWMSYSSAVSMAANGVVYARSQDAVGNWSEESSYTVNNIDKIAPVVATFTPSTTVVTGSDVSVVINYPADAVVKQYMVGSSGWQNYSSAVKMTANGTVYARSQDAAGNWSNSSSYNVTNIDKTPPVAATFVPSNTAPTNEDVAVTINYPADAKVKQYKIGTGAWEAYSSAVTMTENGSVYARSQDDAGNWSEESSYQVNNIDKVAPEAPTITPHEGYASTGWFSTAFFDINHPDSTVKKQYRINGGEWVDMVSYVGTYENGTVDARVIDEAGNISEIASVTFNNVDNEKPSIIAKVDTSEPAQKVIVTVTATDSQSGIQALRYVNYVVNPRLANSAFNAGTDINNGEFEVTENGSYTILVKDNVGRLVQTVVVISNIDNVSPEKAIIIADKTEATNKNVVVTVNYPADSVEKLVKVGNGEWVEYLKPITFTENNSLSAKSRDAAGNWSEESTLTVSNIYKVAPPKPVATADKTQLTNEDVVVTVNYEGNVAKKQFRIGNGEWQNYESPFKVTENAVVYFKAEDVVGNSSDSSIEINIIDKVKPSEPVIQVDVDQVTVVPGTDASGVEKTLIKINDGEWSAYTAPIKLNDGEYTIQAKTIDVVGNATEVSKHFFVFDDTLREIEPILGKYENFPTQALKATLDQLLAKIPDSAPQKAALVERVKVAESYTATKEITVAIGNLERTVNSFNVSTGDVVQLKSDLLSIKVKINAMATSDKKTEFLGKAQVLEQKITAFEKVKLVTNNNGGVEEINLDDLAGVIAELPDGDVKTRLEQQVEHTKVVVETKNKLNQLEESPNRADLEAIKQSIKIMANSPEKTAILERIVEVEKEVTANELIEKLESTVSTTNYQKAVEAAEKIKDPVVRQELLDRIQESYAEVETAGKVELAVKERTQESINQARQEVNNLPDGELKNQLYEQLDKVDNQLRLAANSVLIAETSMTLSNIAKAEQAVNALVGSPEKQALLDRIKVAKEVLANRAKENTSSLEENPTPENIKAAEDSAKKMPDGAEKTALLEKIAEVKTEQVSVQLVEKAISTVTTKNYNEALESINKIKDEEVKQSLLDQLQEVKEKVDVIAAVESSVASKSQEDINNARQRINELPDGELKDALFEQLNKVDMALKSAELKLKISTSSLTASNLEKAEAEILELVDSPQKEALLDALEEAKLALEEKESAKLVAAVDSKVKLAEKYKRESYIVSALKASSELPEIQAKAELLARLDAVGKEIGYVIDMTKYASQTIQDPKVQRLFVSWTSYVTKAEAKPTKFSVGYAVKQMNKITDAIKNDPKYATLYQGLAERTLTLQATYQESAQKVTLEKAITKAESQVKFYEKYRKATYKTKAQAAVDVLPEGEAKTAFQARIDAVEPK